MTNFESQENTLYQIAQFNVKISKVNALYEAFQKEKTEINKNIFFEEWKKLHTEVSEFFGLNIETAEAGNHKKIISTLNTDSKIEESYVYNLEKFAQGSKTVKKAEISFSIYNHGDKGANGFPYFGLLIELTLNYDNKTNFSATIAKSKKGCGNLFASQFDVANLTINGQKTEIRFEKAEEFATIYRLCEESIALVNNVLVNKMTSNIKICQR